MYDYCHGGNAAYEAGKENAIDLSANINPLGMPENVRDAIIREIPNCNRYPDSFSHKLCAEIAEFESITPPGHPGLVGGSAACSPMRPEWIFCGNGASDIIFRLPKAVQAKKVMVTAPTFSDYERSALSNGSEIIRYTLNPACFALDDGFIKMVRRERPCLVYVCNPNNPTGILTETGLIRELLGCCRDMGATVAVDECFLDFTEQAAENTCRFFIEEYPNLVILKAFTKLFALPGIRLGYAISSNRALINSLCFHGADWPVSNLAQAAGAAALEGAENFIKATAEYVSAQRMAVEKELVSLGYNTFDSKANYIFFQSPYRFDLYAELDKKGIRIRSCGNYHGLDNSYYRIAVSDKTSNELLVSAITDVTKRRS